MIYQDTNTSYLPEKKLAPRKFLRHYRLEGFSRLKTQEKKQLNCSIRLSSEVTDTQGLKLPLTELLYELIHYFSGNDSYRNGGLANQPQAKQIECYLYSPTNQVHVFSLGLENIHSVQREQDLLLNLVLSKLDQIKLIFPITRIEVSCLMRPLMDSLVNRSIVTQ